MLIKCLDFILNVEKTTKTLLIKRAEIFEKAIFILLFSTSTGNSSNKND
jgi:hypothetical protein